MKDYRTIVVGTDGSSLGEPTVGPAAWLAKHDDADLVIVCAYSQQSRRDEAKNVATSAATAASARYWDATPPATRSTMP